jgi:aminoglycoside phosphotransferase (APT) family kinase protein
MSEGLVTARGDERTRAGLRDWFSRRGVDAQIVLHPSPESNGASHETILFDLVREGGVEPLVARVQPDDDGVFPTPDLHVEYRLQEAIGGGEIPLPGLHGFETDLEFLGAPFYVMERLDGTVAGDSPPYTMMGWLFDKEPDARRAIWFEGLEAMARVHLVEPSELEFVNRGRAIGFDGELQYWGDYGAFAAPEGLPRCAQRAWDWILANYPPTSDIALCWGDSRLGNQIFSDGRCIALLDWEMAALSDPVQDLAWFVYFNDVFTDGIGVPNLAGFPSHEESIARYEDVTGREVDNFDYFYIFAAYRFVAIMHRIGLLMMRDGRLPEDSTFHRENWTTVHLDRVCEQKGIP